jgi:hypothetical protein
MVHARRWRPTVLGHGACHHTHAETSAHEPEVASPIFPIGDVGDIGASNRTCAGDAGHDASGVEDRDLDPAKLIRLTRETTTVPSRNNFV